MTVTMLTPGSYDALHQWMRLHFPKSGRCEFCGAHRKTEYAMVRPTRNRADWFEFCVPCHRRFDGVPAAMSARRAGVLLTSAHRAAISRGLQGNTNTRGRKRT